VEEISGIDCWLWGGFLTGCDHHSKFHQNLFKIPQFFSNSKANFFPKSKNFEGSGRN